MTSPWRTEFDFLIHLNMFVRRRTDILTAR
jgi:hypothetical protein